MEVGNDDSDGKMVKNDEWNKDCIDRILSKTKH